MPETDGNATGKAGAPSEAILDRAHLARMTLGDRQLEVEVLDLFERQADLLLERMRGAPPASVAAFAHTLEGSARGVGVWKVAAAARAVELAARNRVPAALSESIAQLAAVVDEARQAVAALARASDRTPLSPP